MTVTLSDGKSRRSRLTGYDAVRVFVAVVLLVAAGLKAHELATQPVPGTNLLNQRGTLMIAVEGEVALALLLLSGLLRRLAWGLALGSFVFFSFVTLGKALGGAASCGCFGVVEVNPWYTLTLDAALAALLAVFHPPLRRRRGASRPLLRLALALGALVVLGTVLGLAMASYEPTRLTEGGEVTADEGILVLEPHRWVGNRWPLLGYIDVGQRLASGRWTVVLFSHGCSGCDEVMPIYESLAARPGGPRVALLEVPPYEESAAGPVNSESPCLVGRLSDRRDWFVETPVVLELRDGNVLSAAGGQTAVEAARRAAQSDAGSRPQESAQPASPEPSGVELVYPDTREATMDLGTLEPGARKEVELLFRNASAHPVSIEWIRSDCPSCMGAATAPDPIPPDTVRTIEAWVEAPKRESVYTHRFLLSAVGGPGGRHLNFRVRVTARVESESPAARPAPE